jgi:hypothetical protein
LNRGLSSFISLKLAVLLIHQEQRPNADRLEDEYFIKCKLYPNVDFYSGIIYQAMGFKPEMFTVLFAIPRTVGWLAQWEELLLDSEQKIAGPRQVYTGYEARHVVGIGERTLERFWTCVGHSDNGHLLGVAGYHSREVPVL